MTRPVRLASLTDDQLVQGFAAAPLTEQHARFGVVCDRYLGIIQSFCASRLREPEASSDAAQDTFLAAFEDLRSGAEPRSLRPWLHGIAKNRCISQYRGMPIDGGRRRGSVDLLTLDGHADRPEGESLDDLENLSRRRLRDVQRLLDLVASTLTEKQQRLYELAIRKNIRGEALGAAIGMTAKRASTETWSLIRLLNDGFGAYILACDGRPYCAELARIIDAGASQRTPALNPEFTTTLRERIVAHFGTCRTCDNCRTCQVQRERLAWSFTPVLVPVLVLGVTRERIDERIRQTSASAPLFPPPVPPIILVQQDRPPGASRSPSRRRLLPLLLVPLLTIGVIVGAVALRPRGSESAAQPASLAGTWELTPFNEPGLTGPPSTPRWSFAGSCDASETCAFSWLPLISTTTFESQFTQDFREAAGREQAQSNTPLNAAADLVVTPTEDGQAYGGQATAQYGIFDEQNQTFATGQETVILTLVVLESSTGSDGTQLATRLSVNVTYAAHDFEPCSTLCGQQSFDDRRQTVTAVAIRAS